MKRIFSFVVVIFIAFMIALPVFAYTDPTASGYWIVYSRQSDGAILYLDCNSNMITVRNDLISFNNAGFGVIRYKWNSDTNVWDYYDASSINYAFGSTSYTILLANYDVKMEDGTIFFPLGVIQPQPQPQLTPLAPLLQKLQQGLQVPLQYLLMVLGSVVGVIVLLIVLHRCLPQLRTYLKQFLRQ